MKKIIALAMSVMVVFVFTVVMTGCGNEQEALPEEDVDYEIALITDDGLIMDGGHSEVSWNTIAEFGATNGISHKYYKATESTEEAFIEIIKQAINKGAQIVIVDNSQMQDAVYKMQEEYPEIKFALINADPYDAKTSEIKLENNSVDITFDSAQAGYLAGYTAVVEGYTYLGFVGQDESKEVKGFGYGFVKGANRAASDTGVYATIKYTCCEDSQNNEEVFKTASKMYKEGVQVIFTGGKNVQDAVIEAAEKKDGMVIGSNTDCNKKSDKVITSAIYNIKLSLENILKDYNNKEFPGGEVIHYNANNDGIGLELRNNNLEILTQKQYDSIFDELAKGEIKVNIEKNDSLTDLKTTNITIEK